MFLNSVIEYVNNIDLNEKNIAVVFTNKRSLLYFSHYYLENKKNLKAVITPDLFTISSFMSKLSLLEKVEETEVILNIIEISQNTFNSNFLDIAKAKQILDDFNTIDKFLVSDDKINDFLRNMKELSFINAQYSNEDNIITRHINVMGYFSAIYKELQNSFLKEGKGYEGLIYRKAVKNLEKNYINYDEILFVGFNVLTPAEKKVFEYFRNIGIATFFWNIPNKLRDNSEFSTDYVVENEKIFGNAYQDKPNMEKGNLYIYEVEKPIDEVQLVSQILETNDYEPEETAIILFDNELLIPLLHSIPEKIKSFNISLGYPFNASPLFMMFKNILVAHYNRIISEHNNFLGNDILNIFNSPFFLNIISFSENKSLSDLFEQKYQIIKKNLYYLTPNILDFGNCKILTIPNNKNELFLNLINFIKKAQQYFEEKNLFEQYMINYLLNELLALNKFLDKLELLKTRDFIILLQNIITNLSIPFVGQPLKGLQILGLLETRNIEFKNIIFLSANEEFLPKKYNYFSFIPYMLKLHYNIFTQKETNHIWAYHLYRLLSQAKNIHTIYHTRGSDATNSGELSSLFKKIVWKNEIQDGFGTFFNIYGQENNIDKRKIVYSYSQNIITSAQNPSSIKKDEKAIDYLKNATFSITKLSTYVNCPFQFYLNYILNMKNKEEEEVSKEFEYKDFGNVIHYVMQKLYEKFEHNIEYIYNNWEKSYDYYVKEWAKQNSWNIIRGKNKFSIDIAKVLIKNLLEQERKVRLNDLKNVKNIYTEIEIPSKKGNEIALFLENPDIKGYGIIDRLEIYDDKIVIIDYKTGIEKWGKSAIDNFFTLKMIEEKLPELKEFYLNNKDLMQLLFYTKLLKINKSELFNNINHIEIGIYYTKKAIIKILSIDTDILFYYDEMLRLFFNDMFNMEKSFSARSIIDQSHCGYCKYQLLCRK